MKCNALKLGSHWTGKNRNYISFYLSIVLNRYFPRSTGELVFSPKIKTIRNSMVQHFYSFEKLYFTTVEYYALFLKVKFKINALYIIVFTL